MAHHGSSPLDDEVLRAFLGPTREFPRGKITASDEGETRIAIGHKGDTVVLDLGAPTAWIGFTPDQADEIAKCLTDHAAAVRRGD